MKGQVTRLESLSVLVPEPAVAVYEQALRAACGSVGFFLDQPSGQWRIEGVKPAGEGEATLAAALALADAVSGMTAALERQDIPADGWLARTHAAFPEQRIGRRLALRGTHLPPRRAAGRLTLWLDAGVAFGSGEHGSTRGCLLALEAVAHRRPRRILDLGTGSGVLALAAAKLLHRRVIAVDIEPWSARAAAANAARNHLARLVQVSTGNGWSATPVRKHRPYDLVFANILARPLCTMSCDLAQALTPGGTAILAGLLGSQARLVLAAHRRSGLVLERRIDHSGWATLILRKKGLLF